MDKEFFKKNEEHDFKLLQSFNDKTNIFKGLTRKIGEEHYDAYTNDFQRIEIKNRNVVLTQKGNFSGETFLQDTLFLEAHKCADLLLDYYLYGYKPIYINFLKNDVVLIFDLSKLTIRPKKMKRWVNSKGYQNYEQLYREGLYLIDAEVWKNNKKVKEMGEEWKTQQNS